MNKITDFEAVGTQLGVDCEWDGTKVLEIAIAALTECNFHREASILNQMADILNEANGEYDVNYQLTMTKVDNEIPF